MTMYAQMSLPLEPQSFLEDWWAARVPAYAQFDFQNLGLLGDPGTPCEVRREFADARHDIFNADLLLCRRRSVISIGGRGDYSHAAMAGWWRDQLMCVEVREWVGGRTVPLEGQLSQYPDGIDVFRPQITDEERERALDIMIAKGGKRYAYWRVLQASLLHMAFVRLFVRPDTSCDPAEPSKIPEFCSEATCNSYHAASGRDPVPHLADSYTEPNDLARTSFFQYQFTLVA